MYLQRSIHCYHLIVVIWVEKYVVDVMLSCRSRYDGGFTIPIRGIITTKKNVRELTKKQLKLPLTYRIRCGW